jgi:ADP-ribose pyrophosphatase
MSVEKINTVFRGRIITVNVETVRLPNDHVVDLEIIRLAHGAATAAVDANRRVCLIRQFRHAADGWIWELPAGKVEPSEAPQETARRELIEETGNSAARWQPLGCYVASPGVFTELVYLFLAQGLNSVNMQHEPSELIEVHWMDLDEACRWALQGKISDGKTALGLLRARAALDGRDAP